MSQQHKKWIRLVKDKLNSEGMTQTHLARACGVKKPTISELLKYGKGSDKLKNRVCDVLGIDETWVDLGEQDMNEKKQNNDPIKEIIEKHFENMVDDILEHTETYCEAFGAVSCIKGSKIPNMIHLTDCLGKAIRKRAMRQKTPNHNNQVQKDYAFERMCTT